MHTQTPTTPFLSNRLSCGRTNLANKARARLQAHDPSEWHANDAEVTIKPMLSLPETAKSSQIYLTT